MLASRVFCFVLMARASFRNLVQQRLQARARAVDLFGEPALVAGERIQARSKIAILFAQLPAKGRGLSDFLLERGEFGVHRHTIGWKILLSQGVTVGFQCRFMVSTESKRGVFLDPGNRRGFPYFCRMLPSPRCSGV